MSLRRLEERFFGKQRALARAHACAAQVVFHHIGILSRREHLPGMHKPSLAPAVAPIHSCTSPPPANAQQVLAGIEIADKYETAALVEQPSAQLR